MIIRKAKPYPITKYEASDGPDDSQEIGEQGGLTQFGACIDTLLPGSSSSNRHWHENEDEFLHMLSGSATIIDNNGKHIISAGDSVCWPSGDPNAHTVFNHTNENCSYLICGTLVPHDVIHYPDLGRKCIYHGKDWKIVDEDGKVLKIGQVENKPPNWMHDFKLIESISDLEQTRERKGTAFSPGTE